MRRPGSRHVHLAVARPGGDVHITPVVAYDDGLRFWASTSTQAYKARLIDRTGVAAVMVDGRARSVAVDVQPLADAWRWIRRGPAAPAFLGGVVAYGAAHIPQGLWYMRDARQLPEDWKLSQRSILRLRPMRASRLPWAFGDKPVAPPPDAFLEPGRLAEIWPSYGDSAGEVDVTAGWCDAHAVPRLARGSVRLRADGTVAYTHRTGSLPQGARLSILLDQSAGLRASAQSGALVDLTVSGREGETCVLRPRRAWSWHGWQTRRLHGAGPAEAEAA